MLSDVKVKEQNEIKTWKSSAGLENKVDNGDINKTWKHVRWNNQMSATERFGQYEKKRYKI